MLDTLTNILISGGGISLVVLGVWFGLHKLAQAKQWNDERWYGAVHAAIQIVHGMGVSHGPAWLAAAEKAFEDQYERMHGQPPTADDLKAGLADMARVAGPVVLTAMAQKFMPGTATSPNVKAPSAQQ